MVADRPKSLRTVLVADHLWDAFAEMAREMGSDRDALINQALYAFAREHGFVAAEAEPRPTIAFENVRSLEHRLGVSTPPPAQVRTEEDRGSEGRVLVLLAGGRELERVDKDRFVIGRGKHCDLVLSSAKVSREHAAIVRVGEAWFIEDLGSSNGTWFEERRIERRRIEDGDEYSICADKLSCAFR